MKIVVLFLVLATISSAFGESEPKAKVISVESQNITGHNKRDAGDQTAVAIDSKGAAPQQSFQPVEYKNNNYGQTGHYVTAATATPQVVYTKPIGGVQYASNAYKVAYSPQPQQQVAYASVPQVANVKYSQPTYHQASYAPIQVAYAHPGQFQYAYPSNVGQGHGHYQQVAYASAPVQGHAIQFAAVSPYQHSSLGPYQYQNAGSFGQYQHAAPVQYQHSAGQYYQAMPQYAVIAAPAQVGKIATQQSAVLAAPAQQYYQHQPTYTYSIQPSVQVATGKQIIAPTIATPQYRQVSTPIYHSNEGATSYAAFSRQLNIPTAVAPVKVVAQPIYSAATSTPVYQSGGASKVTYGTIAHASSESAPAYTNNAIQYATNLYHPSELGKISSVPNSQKYSYTH